MLPCWRDALLRRPWALWLALLLAVVSALAPTLSPGRAAGHGSAMALQDICASNAPDRLAGLPPGRVQLLVAGLAQVLPKAGPAVVRRAAVALAPPASGPPTFS